MTALAFIVFTVLVFTALFSYETSNDPTQPRLRQYGLFSWLVAGNWTAKVGAGLLIIGVGALLRYALLHLQVPPELKLGSGILCSGISGFIAFFLRQKPSRRALYLAFSGAALGIAYLTAYSAYAFFGYVNDITGLALLVLVALGGGVFAINANTPSIAVLAMTGAFAAPAFAIGHPKPLSIYGYYLAISTLSFLMIWAKGWRPLIHLSFLFTLAGSLFFGWTYDFYRPEHHDVMQPILFALVALHLAMPLAEHHATRGLWLQRFDFGYFLALPIIALVLTMTIAPHLQKEGAIGIAGLSLIWTIAGLILHSIKHEQASVHFLVAMILAVIAAFLYLNNIPWSLIGLVSMAIILTFATYLQFPSWVSALCAGAMLLFAAHHVLLSLLASNTGFSPFHNRLFAERVIAVLALGWAGYVSSKQRMTLSRVLAVIAWAWGAITLTSEILKLNYVYLPQAVHTVLILAAFGISAFYAARTLPAIFTSLLTISIVISAWWAAPSTPHSITIMLVTLGPIALILLGRGGSHRKDGNEVPGILAVSCLLFLVLPWALHLQTLYAIQTIFFPLTLLVATAFVSILLGEAFRWQTLMWHRVALLVFYWTLSICLGAVLLFHIERNFWAVSYELLSLAVIFTIVNLQVKESPQTTEGVVLIILAAFSLQAILLRLFGPAGSLSIFDLAKMQLPALISLMWATLGGGLCWWGAQKGIRSIWSIGATILAVAAVKLVFFDFGSLGQLGNIVALILSGLVFLAVAWLAPFPPASSQQAPRRSTPENTTQEESSQQSDFNSQALSTILLSLALVVLMGAGFFIYSESTHPTLATEYHPKYPPTENTAPEQPSKTPDSNAQSSTSKMDTGSDLKSCTEFAAQLPQEYVLYTIGRDEERKQNPPDPDFPDEIKVTVDKPGRDVVLALGASEATRWKIYATPSTRIAGVYASGYHTPEVSGISPDIPVLKSSFSNQGTCGYFFLTRQSTHLTDAHMKTIFGKTAAFYVLAQKGVAQVGLRTIGDILSLSQAPERISPIQSTSNTSGSNPNTDRMHGTPIRPGYSSGPAPAAQQPPVDVENALIQLIRQGKIRAAREDDIRAWEQVVRSTTGVDGKSSSRRMHRTYVILSDITLPEGLYGAHSATFILARGVPYPLGNPGHSQILNMNDATCNGTACGR